MAFRFEFDRANKVLLSRFEGPITDESFQELRRQIRKHSAATAPRMGIMDYTLVTELRLSAEFIRCVAKEEPVIGNIPRVVVTPTTAGYGLARMFQIAGEEKTTGLRIVRTIEEAFAVLGIQSPHFEPLE